MICPYSFKIKLNKFKNSKIKYNKVDKKQKHVRIILKNNLNFFVINVKVLVVLNVKFIIHILKNKLNLILKNWINNVNFIKNF